MVPVYGARRVFCLLAFTLIGAAGIRWDTGAAAERGFSETGGPRVQPTASMHVARMAHTATTLLDGRVLVVGGFTAEQNAAHSAEAYDRRSERFTALPRLTTLRHSHTATLLQNGTVLIVGGYAEGGRTVTSAEIFDPTRNTFTPTGSLLAPRAGHIAIALRDGTVLIAGGVGPDWQFLSSAERYDPATGRFTATGPMTVARESHAAVRLSDGRVLIVGGHQGRRASITLYASAELYDPTTGTFQRTGDMHVRRHKHDAVLLRDGRVLVSGGSDERDDAGVYRSTELFDPLTGSFRAGPALTHGRYKHNGSSILLPSGMVLMAGGARDAELFDPRRDAFASVDGGGRLSGQFSASTLLRTGEVLITGGYGDDRGPQATAWTFAP